MTKTEMIADLAERNGITKAQARGVLEGLAQSVGSQLARHGEATVPGIVKLKTKRQKAKPARRGINPFTGVEQTFKAKPAKNVVKARPLAAIKDMV